VGHVGQLVFVGLLEKCVSFWRRLSRFAITPVNAREGLISPTAWLCLDVQVFKERRTTRFFPDGQRQRLAGRGEGSVMLERLTYGNLAGCAANFCRVVDGIIWGRLRVEGLR
jgi:hypothetical protein